MVVETSILFWNMSDKIKATVEGLHAQTSTITITYFKMDSVDSRSGNSLHICNAIKQSF